MKTTQQIIDKIKVWEGWRSKAYKALPHEKEYTIGYGHYGSDVRKGMTISKVRGEELLKADLVKFENYVTKYITVPLNVNQFSALVSLTYNCGPRWMISKWGLYRLLMALRYEQAADRMLQYNKAGGKFHQGLANRRRIERDVFLSPVKKPGKCPTCGQDWTGAP